MEKAVGGSNLGSPSANPEGTGGNPRTERKQSGLSFRLFFAPESKGGMGRRVWGLVSSWAFSPGQGALVGGTPSPSGFHTGRHTGRLGPSDKGGISV